MAICTQSSISFSPALLLAQTHSTRGANGLCSKLRQQDVPDLLRDRRDDVDEPGKDRRLVLLGNLGLERVEVDVAPGRVRIQESANDICADANLKLALRDGVGG